MSEPAFTEGPWTSQGWVPTWAYIPVKDARHNMVALMYPDISHGYTRDEVEANARLIATATELYEALDAALGMVRGEGPPNWDWIRSVLAKARGEKESP